MTTYNQPKNGGAKSCKKCRWLPVCIDPCDDCKKLVTGCNLEQGDDECRKIAVAGCKRYEHKLPGVDLQLIECIKKLS